MPKVIVTAIGPAGDHPPLARVRVYSAGAGIVRRRPLRDAAGIGSAGEASAAAVAGSMPHRHVVDCWFFQSFT